MSTWKGSAGLTYAVNDQESPRGILKAAFVACFRHVRYRCPSDPLSGRQTWGGHASGRAALLS